MSAYDLSAGGIGIGVEIHPVGLIAQGVGGGGHGHGDPVVAEAHADVAHDEGVLRELQELVAVDQVLDG